MQSILLMILHALCFESIHVNSLNILVNSPAGGRSHMNFMGSLADLLVDAGHTVHIFVPEMVPGIKTNGTIKAQKIIRQPPTFFESPITKLGLFADPFSDKDMSLLASEQFNIVLNGSLLFCQDFITNKHLLSELRSVSYDVAITEAYDYCPIGLFYMLNIRSTIVTSAVPITDLLAHIFGLPTPLAYVSNLFSSFVDAPKLTYMERVHNIFNYFVSRNGVAKVLLQRENELFRMYVDEDFPDLEHLMRGSTVLFVNTHPLIDIPRPITANIIYIGGVAMRQGKPLSEDFGKLVQSSQKGVILFSLGSITNTTTMPIAMKKGILNAFRRFPDYTFIMKISVSDADKALFADYRNVHTFSWIDQINLLKHPSVVAFITHAGQNSVMESIFAGKPMICIPLFGDQVYNTATMLNKGVAVYVNKNDVNEETLGKALEKVLHDASFAKAARRLKSKLQQYPWDPQGTFVKWVEYAAQFPEADIVLEGATIGFFKYFLFDILIPALLILIVFICFIGKLVQLLLRKLSMLMKTKVE